MSCCGVTLVTRVAAKKTGPPVPTYERQMSDNLMLGAIGLTHFSSGIDHDTSSDRMYSSLSGDCSHDRLTGFREENLHA